MTDHKEEQIFVFGLQVGGLMEAPSWKYQDVRAVRASDRETALQRWAELTGNKLEEDGTIWGWKVVTPEEFYEIKMDQVKTRAIRALEQRERDPEEEARKAEIAFNEQMKKHSDVQAHVEDSEPCHCSDLRSVLDLPSHESGEQKLEELLGLNLDPGVVHKFYVGYGPKTYHRFGTLRDAVEYLLRHQADHVEEVMGCVYAFKHLTHSQRSFELLMLSPKSERDGEL